MIRTDRGALRRELAQLSAVIRYGKVVEAVGTLLRVEGLATTVGEICQLQHPDGECLQLAEVIGFRGEYSLLAPFGPLIGLSAQTRVLGQGQPLMIPVGDALLGRILDGLGRPADRRGPIHAQAQVKPYADAPEPMSRRMIDTPLATGVRLVDGLTTVAEGQRMGIFAPAGVGKSTLLGMFARGTDCDINVIVLIGERGREVREFVELTLGPDGMAKSVIVCATSDRSPLERAKAAHVGTAIAEYFRDQGLKVLLMMDSLTRFARAQREIGLASGEPPTRRGFPPSVFAELPRLLERAGMGQRGSMTALYTVLVEDETSPDPIAEEVRGLIDGHLVLSRDIAARHQYPAIDVLASLSRVMSQAVSQDHLLAAAKLRQLMAKYQTIEPLVQVGEYRQGSDPFADMALERIDAIRAFLAQPTQSIADFSETIAALEELVDE